MNRSTTIAVTLVLASAACQSIRAQEPNPFLMTPAERTAYFEKINSESRRDWERTVAALGLTLPKSHPPAVKDRRRPAGTFQKDNSSNWYDSAGNFYVRSDWGAWNNYDERKANPYSQLPDPLQMADGRRVKDPATWWEVRRPQIVAAFDNEVYGKEPSFVPEVIWKTVGLLDTTIGGTPVIMKTLQGIVDNSIFPSIGVTIQLVLVVPRAAISPVPVVMEFGFIFPPGFSFPGMPKQEGPSWQEQVLGKGWGYAIYVPTSVQADNGAGLRKGIIGLVNRGKSRSFTDWGALRAWAWGASSAMDYFETDSSVDARKVCIEGVSRYGKAVLTAMAYDRRFAVALVASSGKGGAALYRRDYGESMGNICSSSEYHWFAGNLFRYVTAPRKLTVDAHEMIALCAPRPVFISCGSPGVEGNWVDDRGQFLAGVAAGPVYTLLGRQGLGTSTMPPIGTSLMNGTLAYRQHEDGHTVGPNWPYFLDFAEAHFKKLSQQEQ
jgi:hypothetical protein